MNQHEFSRKLPLLLCLSNTAALCEIRCRVLRTRFAVLSLHGIDELKALPDSGAFDLLLLCHSLSLTECVEATKLAYRRWPHMKVMGLLTMASCDGPGGLDASLEILAGPTAMLEMIEQLLRLKRTVRSTGCHTACE